MKGIVVFAVVLTLSGLVPVAARADQGSTGNINFTLGAKSLDEDDWEPVEDHGEFGIHLDFRPVEWPVNIAIALLGSTAEEDEVILGTSAKLTGTTSELRFGVQKIWEPTTTMRPYLGGGLALISAEGEVEVGGVSVSDDDSALGVWLGGGVYWTLGQHFNLGLNLAWSKAEVTIFDVDVEAGGGHAGLLLGYHW